MSTEKIEKRLRDEIERLERARTPAQKLSVIVEPSGAAPDTGEAHVATMERDVRAAQEPLRRRLTAMGVTDLQQLTLANALVADLTPAQVRELASDSGVKRLTWNLVEKVTP